MESNFYLDGSLNTDTKPGDGLIVASGANPDRETYVVTLKPGAGTWHQLGLDVVQDESLPGARYARGADRFLLSEVEAELVENESAGAAAAVHDGDRQRYAAGGLQHQRSEHAAARRDRRESRAPRGAFGFGEARNPFLALRFADAVHTTEDTTIVVTLRHESELRRAVIGRFRLALAADAFAWPPTADAGRRPAAGIRAAGRPGRAVFPRR